MRSDRCLCVTFSRDPLTHQHEDGHEHKVACWFRRLMCPRFRKKRGHPRLRCSSVTKNLDLAGDGLSVGDKSRLCACLLADSTPPPPAASLSSAAGY